jgi:hypothetical protein
MKTKDILFLTIIAIITASIAYGGYILERKINYSLSYKEMVKNEIRNMVSSECLVGNYNEL